MAPEGLSCLLDLEITSAATRPPARPCGGQDTDPAHDARETAVGRTAPPRRTLQAWDRNQSGCCLQIHDPAPKAAIANLEDIPSEPRQRPSVCRFLRRADCHLSAPVCVHRPASRAPPHRAFRRNRAPRIAMGLTAAPGSVSMGDRAAAPDPGPRWSAVFQSRLEPMGFTEVLTAPRSPWQNAYVERVIGTIRRECLNHVIVLSEGRLRRILSSYFDYYRRSRTHLSLEKDCPEPRLVHPPDAGKVIAFPQVAGFSATVPVNPRGCLKRLLRSTPPPIPPHLQGVPSRDVRCLEPRLACRLIRITIEFW